MSGEAATWWVYIIRTEKGKLYTGITTNLERRFKEHSAVAEGKGGKGAKYFRQDTPLHIVFREAHSDRSAASKREYEIKQMGRVKKEQLF